MEVWRHLRHLMGRYRAVVPAVRWSETSATAVRTVRLRTPVPSQRSSRRATCLLERPSETNLIICSSRSEGARTRRSSFKRRPVSRSSTASTTSDVAGRLRCCPGWQAWRLRSETARRAGSRKAPKGSRSISPAPRPIRQAKVTRSESRMDRVLKHARFGPTRFWLQGSGITAGARILWPHGHGGDHRQDGGPRGEARDRCGRAREPLLPARGP